MSIARAEARAREIIATARVKMGPEIVAVKAIGPDGGDDEYHAALAVAVAARDWKPKPLYDIPRWRPVLGGAVATEGNLIHLRLGDDIVPAVDLEGEPVEEQVDQPADTPETPVERAERLGMAATAGITATPFEWLDLASISPRPWVWGRWLLRKTAAAVVAPGGVGKSTFMAGMALSLVTGRPLLGQPVHGGKQRVWLWNLEDPMDEMQRTILAAAKHHGLGPSDLEDRLYVDTAMEGKGLCTAVEGVDGFKLLAPVYSAVTAEIRNRRIDVLVIDPFVSSHEVDENHNVKLDKIVKAWARVANDANCVIVLVHHTSKAGAEVVTAMSARGGKALTDAVRSALVLNRMSTEVAAKHGFDNVERRRYFSVCDDKHNRAPATGADWFRLESIHLGNGGNLGPGDSVGVAVPWSPPRPMEGIGDAELVVVQAAIGVGEWRESSQSPQWAGGAVASALGLDPKTDRRRIKAMLATWIAQGALVVVERKTADHKTRKFIEVSAPE